MHFPARIHKLWVSSESFSFPNTLAHPPTHTDTQSGAADDHSR